MCDSCEQILVDEWLGQKLDRPSFHGLHGHRDVAVAREEDGRHVLARSCHLLLQFHATQGATLALPMLKHMGSLQSWLASQQRETEMSGRQSDVVVDDGLAIRAADAK
jgi:hypothetical protein